MISSLISRASAGLLALVGLTLLFAADVVLPRLVPGFPVAGAWMGQILAAACLALATLDWLNRSALLGGIYGRAVVLSNAMFYFVTAMVLLRTFTAREVPAAVWILIVPVTLLAIAYCWLLLRGPVAGDLESHRLAQEVGR